MPLHTSLEQDGLDYLLVDLAFLHFIKVFFVKLLRLLVTTLYTVDEDCHEPVSSRFILDQDSDNSDSEIFRRSLLYSGNHSPLKHENLISFNTGMKVKGLVVSIEGLSARGGLKVAVTTIFDGG
ncbi:hypothetical protein V6N11_012567 [Hibiscus sabdariffa]|uniref:Uncharacterized protein n=1 Tax=Hibiscus sabdariffa TaxID=183260 RepID=A0ABR2QBI7_9ROSI